jgi:hypothetical protein
MSSIFLRCVLLVSVVVLPVGGQEADPLRQEPRVAAAPENTAALQRLDGEYLILCGGPSLRKWEDLRRPTQRHDRWWANFVAATNVRTRQLVDMGTSPGSITWLVFRPGYVARGLEEGKPLTTWIRELAGRRGANLVWFDSQQQLIDYINRGNHRASNKIVSFDYFGHSNKHCYLLDYSSEILGASTVSLHERDFKKLSRAAFDKRAFVKSWGCHTGESMSRAWRAAMGSPMWGALGKTDYVPTGRGQLPELSTAAGEWAR